jgi:hypothetical protein
MPGLDRGRAMADNHPVMRRFVTILLALVALSGCSDHSNPVRPAPRPPRTWRMGFSAIPPRPDFNSLLASLQMWSTRADAAIIHIDPPWDSLLAGRRADSLVLRDPKGLVDYYRGRGFALWLTLDATNGLDRASENEALVRNGRSLSEPAVQQLYRDYAVALDTLLHPDHLGLGAETNLIRLAAPAALYDAVRQTCNAAAADVRAVDPSVDLYVSVQVEVAWGRLGGTPGPYVGVDQDFADFPFTQSLGLSSYPYFVWTEPESLPLDYYARLVQGRTTPVAVVEGGWTSASVGGITSSQQKESRYISRHAALLDSARAIGMFQLTFTDLDLTASPPPPGSILPLFASIGLVDVNLAPKLALSSWDALYARPLAAPLAISRSRSPAAWGSRSSR